MQESMSIIDKYGMIVNKLKKKMSISSLLRKCNK